MAAAVPVDVQTAGLLAANMLQCWIASERAVAAPGAHALQDVNEGGADDVESAEPPPAEASLHLCPAVDDGAGAPSPGEYRAPVRPPEPGRGDDVGAGVRTAEQK